MVGEPDIKVNGKQQPLVSDNAFFCVSGVGSGTHRLRSLQKTRAARCSVRPATVRSSHRLGTTSLAEISAYL